MGFKIPRRSAILEFDGDFKGAEIACRLDVNTETYFAVTRLQNDVGDGDDESKIRAVLAFFVDHIATGWNLEDDDGQPIELTVNSLMTLPANLTLAIIPKWKEAATGVPVPLEQPSSDGNSSVEE